MFCAVIVISKDGTWEASTGIVYVVFMICTLSHGVLAMTLTKIMNKLQTVAVVLVSSVPRSHKSTALTQNLEPSPYCRHHHRPTRGQGRPAERRALHFRQNGELDDLAYRMDIHVSLAVSHLDDRRLRLVRPHVRGGIQCSQSGASWYPVVHRHVLGPRICACDCDGRLHEPRC